MKILSTESFAANRVKAIAYGISGAGKTHLAKTLPHSKTLIISAEAGLLTLGDAKIDVIDITVDDTGTVVPKELRIKRLTEVFKFLNTDEAKKKYEYIFIDSLTEISQNLVEQLATEFPDRKDALPMWGEYAKRLRALIKSFRDLPDYHVVMTCLATNEKDENGRVVHRFDVNGKIATRIPGFFDEVFFVELVNKKGFVRTENTEKTLGKDRSGQLAATEDADLTKIFSKILKKGEIKDARKLG